MSRLVSISVVLLFTNLLLSSQSRAAELYGLSPGPIEFQSAGPIAFGPSGVLFVGDAKAAKIYAINTEDQRDTSASDYDIKDLTARLSKAIVRSEEPPLPSSAI